MRGKRYYLIVSLIILLMILIILGVYLLDTPKQSNKQEIESHKVQKDIEKKENFIEPEELIKDVKKFENNVESMQIKDLNLNEDINTENKYILPFKEVDISDVKTIKKSEVSPISAIYIKKDSIATANIGDTIELPMLGNSNYRMKVTDKQKNKSGSVTISGSLLEDNKYGATFTESKKGVYGSITTPNGAYEIESQDGEGYIYSVEDIEKRRVNYKHSDEIVLDKE